MKSAAQVGAFVVLFLALAFGAFAVLKSSLFAEKRDLYYACFADAGGITEGSAVLIAGVRVGEVSGVELGDDGLAYVAMQIDRERKLPIGTTASVPTSFIGVGDRQLLLKVPAGRSGETYEPENRSNPIPGNLQGPLENILPDTSQTMEEVNKTLAAFRELLQDQELKDGLLAVMSETERTAAKFGGVADSVNDVIVSNQSTVDRMLLSVSDSLDNVYAITLRVKEMAEDPRYAEKADQLLTTLNTAAEEGAALVRDLRATTNDPELRASLTNTLNNFETMSESGVKIAADAEVMSKNGIDITQQTKELLEKANRVVAEVERVLAEFKGTVGDVLGAGGAAGLLPKVDIEADLFQQTDPGRLRTDVNFRFGLGDQSLIFGFYDAFESNKLNLMFERPFNEKTDFRYGVYASKPGLGVSYALAPRLSLFADYFGINDPQFDLRLRYDFSGDLHGWAGVERVFGGNSPVVGIGFRR